MTSKMILLPVCAQALLTLLVWVWLFTTRVSTLRKNRINPQELANPTRFDEILKDVIHPAENFENLFEMPVLFYVVALVIFLTGLTDEFYVAAAWLFVALRAIHSWVHCTYNRVMHRFWAYLASSILVWAMWIRVTIQLCA